MCLHISCNSTDCFHICWEKCVFCRCLNIFVFVCMYVFIWVCMCGYTRMWRPEVTFFPHCLTPYCFLRRKALPELINSARSAGQWAPGGFLSAPGCSSTGVDMQCRSGFYVDAGDQIQVPALHGGYFTKWAIPAPVDCSFMVIKGGILINKVFWLESLFHYVTWITNEKKCLSIRNNLY